MLFFAALAAVAAACDGDEKGAPTPAAGAATPAASATTGAPACGLSSQVGVRGDLPNADQIALAARYGLTQGRAAESKPFAGERDIGHQREFTVVRLTGGALDGTEPPEPGTIAATLLAKSAHAYFYVDDAIGADAGAVETAARDFEEGVWPAVTGAFGEPESPGVDGDPRIIVLQADLGGAVGGYYSGDDAYLRAVKPYSNEAEMLYMDRTFTPGGGAFNVVLAHELQHLIHHRNDEDEEAWVNEGLSEVAALLAGGAGSTIDAFSNRPETQLNAWSHDDSAGHYGAGAAFFRYLSSRLGGDPVLGGLARAQGDGAAGVDEYLASEGGGLRFAEVFADWIAANVLDRSEGRFGNPSRPVGVTADDELTAGAPVEGEAAQFGTDYYSIATDGQYVLRFDGAETVPVLTTDPGAGQPVLWANAQDDIDTTLTRELDLTDASDPALTFRTWHDIERWYDWGYVAVSTDGGGSWRALAGDQTTTDDPVRVALGPGYSGKSGGGDEPAWVDERISLAVYAGRKVLLRFEYVTDGASYGEGWLIDDVAVEAAGFRDDDGSDGGWQRDGWVRIDAPLPQTYVVRFVGTRQGEPHVLDVPLDAANRGELRIDAAIYVDLTLAIAGTTEGTISAAPYTVELVPAPP